MLLGIQTYFDLREEGKEKYCARVPQLSYENYANDIDVVDISGLIDHINGTQSKLLESLQGTRKSHASLLTKVNEVRARITEYSLDNVARSSGIGLIGPPRDIYEAQIVSTCQSHRIHGLSLLEEKLNVTLKDQLMLYNLLKEKEKEKEKQSQSQSLSLYLQHLMEKFTAVKSQSKRLKDKFMVYESESLSRLESLRYVYNRNTTILSDQIQILQSQLYSNQREHETFKRRMITNLEIAYSTCIPAATLDEEEEPEQDEQEEEEVKMDEEQELVQGQGQAHGQIHEQDDHKGFINETNRIGGEEQVFMSLKVQLRHVRAAAACEVLLLLLFISLVIQFFKDKANKNKLVDSLQVMKEKLENSKQAMSQLSEECHTLAKSKAQVVQSLETEEETKEALLLDVEESKKHCNEHKTAADLLDARVKQLEKKLSNTKADAELVAQRQGGKDKANKKQQEALEVGPLFALSSLLSLTPTLTPTLP